MYETTFHNTSLKDKKFLVTGGSGFIGSNIVNYLLKHGAQKVRVLDNLSTGFKRNLESFGQYSSFEFIEGDITDLHSCKQACEGMDYLSHHAALGSVPRSIKNPLATHAVNSTGFLNMLVAAKEAQVKRVVYASSSSVYGDHPGLPKKEEAIGKPLSPYAVSKQTNELYAQVFTDIYNLEIIGLRYFNIFGPNQSPEGAYAAVIPLFMEAVLTEQSPVIDGDGEQTRDFTFVENAVQANIKAMLTENRDALGRVYNIAVGENVSINNLLRIIGNLANVNIKPDFRPSRTGDVRNSLADISSAEKLLDYHPAVRLEEGLKITFEWFKKAIKHV